MKLKGACLLRCREIPPAIEIAYRIVSELKERGMLTVDVRKKEEGCAQMVAWELDCGASCKQGADE